MKLMGRPGARVKGGWRHAVVLLLAVPYVGTLWVSSYASIAPEVWGIPFFYWYQFLWIAIGAVITSVVYLAESPAERAAEDRRR